MLEWIEIKRTKWEWKIIWSITLIIRKLLKTIIRFKKMRIILKPC